MWNAATRSAPPTANEMYCWMRPVWNRRTTEPKAWVVLPTQFTAPSTMCLSIQPQTKPSARAVLPVPTTSPSTTLASNQLWARAATIVPRMTEPLTNSSM